MLCSADIDSETAVKRCCDVDMTIHRSFEGLHFAGNTQFKFLQAVSSLVCSGSLSLLVGRYFSETLGGTNIKNHGQQVHHSDEQ